MDESAANVLSDLFKEESLGAILVAVAALLLFGFTFIKSREYQQWYQNIFHSIVVSVLFFGLTFGGNLFLKSNISSFNSIYQSFTKQGSLSWNKWTIVRRTWPGWITQNELVVKHFSDTQTLATLPVEDPLSQPLYKTIISRQEIPQNSIVGFSGDVDLTLENNKNPYGFNGFWATTNFKYYVVNQSDLKAETEFLFPMDTNRIVYQNISILVDGDDVKTLAKPEGLRWKMEMTPHQKVVIDISYDARGMDGYTYSVSESREIKDFELTISSNSDDVFSSFAPSGESIDYRTIIQTDGSFRSIAKIDAAVVSPAMSVFYVQPSSPYSPQDTTLRILRFMPRASIFLAVVFVLTLLISSTNFYLPDLLYFQALAWIGPLVFMIVCLVLNNLMWALFWIGLFIAILQYFFLLTLKMKVFPLLAILTWTIVLMGIYPLSGRSINSYPVNQYDNLVLIGIIVYVFAYALSQRIMLFQQRKLAAEKR